jgi:hypothetical protein
MRVGLPECLGHQITNVFDRSYIGCSLIQATWKMYRTAKVATHYGGFEFSLFIDLELLITILIEYTYDCVY